ncbi:MAG TPA: hypothetical protein VGL56_13530 [Fimbriimonadaceae bacterium]|jgi:hypothetical protein
MPAKLALEPGESILHEQILMYCPPEGGKLNGKLSVTNTRVHYEAKYDASLLGTLKSTMVFTWGGDAGYLDIPKSEIAGVTVEKKLLSKKAIVTLNDGSKHIFDAGALGIDKAAETIQAK